MTPDLEIEPGPHWWETSEPSLLFRGNETEPNDRTTRTIKNPNWPEGNQLAIYNCSREVERGTTRIKFNLWLERVLNPLGCTFFKYPTHLKFSREDAYLQAWTTAALPSQKWKGNKAPTWHENSLAELTFLYFYFPAPFVYGSFFSIWENFDPTANQLLKMNLLLVIILKGYAAKMLASSNLFLGLTP